MSQSARSLPRRQVEPLPALTNGLGGSGRSDQAVARFKPEVTLAPTGDGKLPMVAIPKGGSQSARGPLPPPLRGPPSLAGAAPGPDENQFGMMRGEASDLQRILENHRRECERSGDFESARITRERLGKLRLAQVKKQKKDLLARHAADTEALQQELDRGMQEFLDIWRTEKVPELESCVSELLSEMRERQTIELRQFQTRLNAEPFKPKFSPAVLDMQRRMECLGEQEMYEDAKKLKAQIKKQQEMEQLRTHAGRLKAIEAREAAFRAKLEKEMGALMDKIRTLRMEKARQQEREFRELSKQHASTMAFLEAQHAIERSRLSQEVKAVLERNKAKAPQQGASQENRF